VITERVNLLSSYVVKSYPSGQGQNRTADTRIFSPLLYQLSYLAKPLSRNYLPTPARLFQFRSASTSR
jgi:hypothetical protein